MSPAKNWVVGWGGRSPDANDRLIGAYLPVEPSAAPEDEPE